jgi:hypothetical protein
MANPEHVALVKRGAAAIRRWRENNPDGTLDLREANLREADLAGADLIRADLRGAKLHRARRPAPERGRASGAWRCAGFRDVTAPA